MKMRKGKIGKIFVKYGEPIDLDSFCEKNMATSNSLSL